MTDETERPPKRGEAAWKEVREAVAARNQAVRKSSRVERDAFDRKRDKVRRAAEHARHASVPRKRVP